jgi:hypothetical protein
VPSMHVCITRTRCSQCGFGSDWISKSTTTSPMVYMLTLSDLQGYVDLDIYLITRIS